MGDDPFHQLTAIVALAIRLGKGAHRVGIGGETEDIARAVRRAVRLHKALPPVFIGGGVLRHDPGDALAVARPELADIDGHGIAVFGVGNGGGEELGERLCAKARIERRPARGRARDHRGEPALFAPSAQRRWRSSRRAFSPSLSTRARNSRTQGRCPSARAAASRRPWRRRHRRRCRHFSARRGRPVRRGERTCSTRRFWRRPRCGGKNIGKLTDQNSA